MGYEELKVSADHMVGKFKYVIGEDKKRTSKVFHVYLQEAQLNVTPAGGNGYVHVCTMYKVNYRGHAWWVKERDIYDTEKKALEKLESVKTEIGD